MFVAIESKNNRILKQIRSLTQRKYREKEAKFILEGRVAVKEALNYAKKPAFMIASKSFMDKVEREAILDKAAQRDIPVYLVSDNIFLGLTQTQEPQGVLLVLGKQESTWQELAQNANPLWIIIDGLQDPGNLGTIVRTAAAVGADGLILTRETVDLYNDKSLRSTMGAIFRINVIQGVSAEDIVSQCQRLGLALVVADPRGNIPYYELDFLQGMALVIGSEFQGPSLALSAEAKVKVTIPMPGHIESLNAGVAAGILMFEKVRQQRSRSSLDKT